MTTISDKLGYCCINETLRSQDIYTGRKLQKKTFTMEKADDIAVQNCKDILRILKWNEDNNIRVYRISSEILTRCSDPDIKYGISDLKSSNTIYQLLDEVGKFAKNYGHHLSFHPGQFVCLGSPSDDVRSLGILAIECENALADAICKSVDIDIPINIHIGGSYGQQYEDTSIRFVNSFNTLSESLQRRLCVENDDKGASWSTKNLYDYIYKKISVPITFDFHHYLFRNDEPEIDLKTAFTLAKSTWGNRNMQIHYSQSPTPDKLIPAHSDYYRDPLPVWLSEFDNFHIHLECKAKELGLQKYRKDFC
jgi:UV DNA damage endonuclease